MSSVLKAVYLLIEAAKSLDKVAHVMNIFDFLSTLLKDNLKLLR